MLFFDRVPGSLESARRDLESLRKIGLHKDISSIEEYEQRLLNNAAMA
jgi:hypothetical protein